MWSVKCAGTGKKRGRAAWATCFAMLACASAFPYADAQATATAKIDRSQSASKLARPPVVRYVDRRVASSGDGTSWATAFKTIQEGIDAVAITGLGELWVVEGTYDEARVSEPHGDGVNTGSVVMKPGVHLYGGFVGNETSRWQRDAQLHITVISGKATRAGLDAYHVIVGADSSTLDGFLVSGGNADGNGEEGSGGGIYNSGVAPVITRCVITANKGQYNGGMANLYGASPTVTECAFIGNEVTVNGAGMGNWPSCFPNVSNCVFSGNISGRLGGGIVDADGSSTTVTNCVFIDNTAQRMGGAIADYRNATTKVTNTLFVNNKVVETSFGGGGLGAWESSPELINCTFSTNSGPSGTGAAVYSNNSLAVLTNCILWNDTGGEVKGNPIITFSNVQGGYTGTGNIDADPLFVDPVNADYALTPGSPCIDSGTTEGAPATDFLGVPRPSGAGVDMGAFEFPSNVLHGWVRDAATGAPLPCAAVLVREAADGQTAQWVASTDLNGGYRIEGLAPGSYVVEAYAPEHVAQSRAISVPRGITGSSFSLVRSALAGGVYGACTDRDLGQPLSGVQVDAYVAAIRVATTYTGACGRYEINGIAAKADTAVTLEFSSEGYETEQSVVNVPSTGGTEADQVMTPKFAIPGSIAGILTDAQTAQPLVGARVTANGLGPVSADSNAYGAYALAALPEGQYTLTASATDYEAQYRTLTVAASAVQGVNFALRPLALVPPSDVNCDSAVNALDIQFVINAALGLATGYDCDINADNAINALDIQFVINSALGL